MHINSFNDLNSFTCFCVCLLKEKILPSITQQQKKVLLVTSVAFACLAASYAFYFYCLKPKKNDLAEGVAHKEKNSLNLNNSDKKVNALIFPSANPVEEKKKLNGHPLNSPKSLSAESEEPLIEPVDSPIANPMLPNSPIENPPTDEKNPQTLNYNDGRIYVGFVKNGKANGQGKMTYPYKTIEEGEFKNDKLHGIGTKFYTSGSVYKGEFVCGFPNGQGKMTYKDGIVEEGEYKLGELYHGKIDFNQLRICEGYFDFGTLKLSGKITYKDGTVYVGEVTRGDFPGGVPHGQGKMAYSDGTIEEGQFKNGFFVK